MEQHFYDEWATNVFDMFESNPSIDNYDWGEYGTIITQKMFKKLRNTSVFYIKDIIANKNLTFEQKLLWIKRSKADFYVDFLCKSVFISYDYIFAHPRMIWDKTIISANPKLTMDIILRKPTDYWDWNAISEFTTIPIKDIIANRHLPWNWAKLSRNENANIDSNDMFNNKDLPWDWNVLCNDFSVDLCHITNNPELPWDWSKMHDNEYITLEFVENHIDESWDWEQLQKNPIITIDFMLKHKDKYWDWNLLSKKEGLERQQQYMEHMIVTCMVATIYEQQTYNNGKCANNAIHFRQTNVEYVFADEYVVCHIARY